MVRTRPGFVLLLQFGDIGIVSQHVGRTSPRITHQSLTRTDQMRFACAVDLAKLPLPATLILQGRHRIDTSRTIEI